MHTPTTKELLADVKPLEPGIDTPTHKARQSRARRQVESEFVRDGIYSHGNHDMPLYRVPKAAHIEDVEDIVEWAASHMLLMSGSFHFALDFTLWRNGMPEVQPPVMHDDWFEFGIKSYECDVTHIDVAEQTVCYVVSELDY